MTVEKVRQAHQAKPFRPFTFTLADGSEVYVPHPEVMLQMPGGRTIIVGTGPEEHQVIDILMITKMTFRGSKARRNGRP